MRGWEGGLVVGGCRACRSCIGVSPMDENSPLSPKANAFSIASLISVAAAERAGKGALEERRSAPARPGCRPQKMHFSTVTRDMEGECRPGPRSCAEGPPGPAYPRPAAWPGAAHGARPACPRGRPGEAWPFLPARLGPCSPPLEKRIARGPVAALDGSSAGTGALREALKASPDSAGRAPGRAGRARLPPRPGGCVPKNARDPRGPEEPFSTGGSEGAAAARAGLSQPAGPARPGAGGCTAGPARGSSARTRSFALVPASSPFSPGDGRNGALPN